MYKNKVSMYSSEDVIEEFYDAIADGDSKKLRRVHIPKSDVFYVRESLRSRRKLYFRPRRESYVLRGLSPAP